jgi:hypothetical protein
MTFKLMEGSDREIFKSWSRSGLKTNSFRSTTLIRIAKAYTELMKERYHENFGS